MIVRTKDTFTETDPLQAFPGRGSYPEREVQLTPGFLDFRFKDPRKVLTRDNGFQLFLQGFPGIAFALGLGLLTLKEFLMKFFKFRLFFPQGGFNPGDLSVQEMGTTGDDYGTGLAPDFFGGPISANSLKPGISEGTEATKRDLQ